MRIFCNNFFYELILTAIVYKQKKNSETVQTMNLDKNKLLSPIIGKSSLVIMDTEKCTS